MNALLSNWNALDPDAAIAALLNCCSSRHWAEQLVRSRPYDKEESLFIAADRVWAQMTEPDWLEAFMAHPRIGQCKAAHASAQSSAWSRQEQSDAETAREQILDELANGNVLYEDLFGFTYIVCATGKSAEEMLQILHRRLNSDRQAELREAAEQQRQIMQIRLRKWLQI